MPAVRQKPIAALAFKRGGRGVMPVLPAPPAEVPEPPNDVGEHGLQAWKLFWTTDVSGAVNLARDGERLRHWCRCVDVRESLWQDFRMTMHPKWRKEVLTQIRFVSREIEEAERQFGMTPLYKMRLTGALDQAEAAESSIKARRGRAPQEA